MRASWSGLYPYASRSKYQRHPPSPLLLYFLFIFMGICILILIYLLLPLLGGALLPESRDARELRCVLCGLSLPLSHTTTFWAIIYRWFLYFSPAISGRFFSTSAHLLRFITLYSTTCMAAWFFYLLMVPSGRARGFLGPPPPFRVSGLGSWVSVRTTVLERLGHGRPPQ